MIIFLFKFYSQFIVIDSISQFQNYNNVNLVFINIARFIKLITIFDHIDFNTYHHLFTAIVIYNLDLILQQRSDIIEKNRY